MNENATIYTCVNTQRETSQGILGTNIHNKKNYWKNQHDALGSQTVNKLILMAIAI